MARARGANAILAAAFESTYGTPPASGFVQLPFVSAALGEEQKLIANDLLGLGREPQAPVLDVIVNEGDIVVPVDLRNFGYWLKLLLGAPATTPNATNASGRFNFSAQPAVGSTITLNGTTVTFVASGATGNQVNIGASLAATLTNAATMLNASADTQISKCSYAVSGTAIVVTYDTAGTAGNSFTLAASASSNAAPSAPTLQGGGNRHTFQSGALSLPSLAAEIGMPEIPIYGMNFGIRANTLKIQMQRSGLLNATIGLIAQGETKAASSQAGSPTSQAIQRFTQFAGQVAQAGTPLGQIVSAEFNYSNNLDKVEVIRTDGRIEDADPALVAVTGSIAVRFADTVLLNRAQSALATDIEFSWTLPSGFSLTFDVPSVYLPRAKQPITGPGGVQATFAWEAAKDATAGYSCAAILVNDMMGY